MNRYKRAVGIFLVNLAVLGVGIVIVELVFGTWFNPNNLNRLNLIKDMTFSYDVSGLYETASPNIKYSRDRYGLRGVYGDDPSRINILTVGGSTTDQRYISDGLTWQDVLQSALASAGTPVVVANAGVDGQSTFGHIKDFDWWFPYVPHLKPRYVLFYIGLNDTYIDDDSEYDDLVHIVPNPLIAAIKENSAVYHLLRTIRGSFRATAVLKIGHTKVDFTKVQWTGEALQQEYAFLSPRLDAFANRLRVLVDKTRKLGSEPIFVTQASRHFKRVENEIRGRADVMAFLFGRKINGVDYYHLIGRFNGVMATVAREKQVVFVDLAADWKGEDGDFYDWAHMTPRGARKVGLYLFENLRDVVSTGQTVAESARKRAAPRHGSP